MENLVFLIQRKVLSIYYEEVPPVWEDIGFTHDINEARKWQWSAHRFEDRQFKEVSLLKEGFEEWKNYRSI